LAAPSKPAKTVIQAGLSTARSRRAFSSSHLKETPKPLLSRALTGSMFIPAPYAVGAALTGSRAYRLGVFGKRRSDGWATPSSNRCGGKISSEISTVIVEVESIRIGPYGPSNSTTVRWLC
jgi:hypothetical protein